MAKPILDTDKDKEPIDPAVERVRRKLMRFVVINLGLLFIALMAVVLAVVYKSRGPATESPRSQAPEIQLPAGNETLQADISLPAGARLLSQSLSGNHVSLLTELSDGSHMILVFDISKGRVVGRFTVKNH